MPFPVEYYNYLHDCKTNDDYAVDNEGGKSLVIIINGLSNQMVQDAITYFRIVYMLDCITVIS